jgi:hypothetical protein
MQGMWVLALLAAAPFTVPASAFTARGASAVVTASTACEGSAAKVESSSARMATAFVALPPEVTGQRRRLAFTVDARATAAGQAPLRPPFAFADVELGTPLHRFAGERVRVESPCQRVTLELDVPIEAKRVVVGAEASGVGFFTLSAVEVTVLGRAAPVDWPNHTHLGRVGDFWFNDGLVVSRHVGVGGEVHLQPDGSLVGRDGDFVRPGAQPSEWLVKLGARQGRFVFSFDGTTHRFEGTWGTTWKSYPTRLEWSPSAVVTSWGELHMELTRFDGAQVEEGCHRYSWCGRAEKLLDVCGLEGEVPQAQALAAFLLDGFERTPVCTDPIP